jgi:hypothetical protein
MALSNETPASTEVVDKFRETINEIRTKNLADRLVKYEHNPDPREAPNPNRGIRVRRIDMEKSVARGRVPVTQECADHNSRVSVVGHPERFQKLWGGQS